MKPKPIHERLGRGDLVLHEGKPRKVSSVKMRGVLFEDDSFAYYSEIQVIDVRQERSEP